MTSEEHNKALGIMHIVYGAMHLLMITFCFVFLFAFFLAIGQAQRDFPPAIFFGLIFAFSFIFYLILTVPSFVAGYGLLKRRHWAKTASIVAAVMESMAFPIGTALCVYSLWFSFGEAGTSLYGKPLIASSFEKPELKAPVSPPDWR